MEQIRYELYKKIANRNPAEKSMLATVIEGPHIGEKIYFSGETAVCALQEDGFLAKKGKVLLQAAQNGRVEADGEQIFCEQIGNPPVMVI